MAYGSVNRRKPIERASKISHTEIINNPDVVQFLQNCRMPAASDPEEIAALTNSITRNDGGTIKHIVALDGGYTETVVKVEFPSASITFFNFGPLLLKLDDLKTVDNQEFINPRDLAKLKQIHRHSLVFPTKNICRSDSTSLIVSIRRTLLEFFIKPDVDNESLMNSLRWLLFQEWQSSPKEWILSTCPYDPTCSGGITFKQATGYEILCPGCGQPVWLTDTFRLHEAIDEEQGAGGVLGYLIVMLEQMLLVQWIRAIYRVKPSMLSEVLFVKDGPLAFFGQTANFHKPMRALMAHLLKPNTKSASLRLVGVEKSGPFVEHAAAIQQSMPSGSILIPSNEYIYRHIIPGASTLQEYGRTTYYGWKVFFRDWDGAMYVLTLPSAEYNSAPTIHDFVGLEDMLSTIGSLKCHMYENALIPVALVNKLVSLSDFPSSQILRTFARQTLSS